MRICATILVTLVLVAAAGHAGDEGSARLESRGEGLQAATFDTLSGTVTVYLPEDIAAGDTISGTVEADPAGDSDKKREKNLGTLSGYVLEVEDEDEDEREEVGDGRFAVHVPEAPRRDEVVRLVLREIRDGKPGREIDGVDVPLRSPSETPGEFRLPSVAQTGRSAIVRGPFDGDLATTGLTVGEIEALPLAESPRMAIFRTPQEIVGVSRAALRERGETVAEGEIRNVAVSLSAPKLDLMKGESTTLTTVVTGLEDLGEEIPLELDVSPPAVVAVEGGNRHTVVIRPGDVGENGAYRLSLRVTGRLAGGWNAEATVRVPEPEPPADRFALVIEGEVVGYIAVVSREPIVFEAGLGLGRPLYDWIESSFENGPVRRSGEIVGCDQDGVEREVQAFHAAVIDSVRFPPLDASDDSPAYLTIALGPESIRHEEGSGKRVHVPQANEKWMRSNFSFELGGRSVERVNKIQSFTWKQKVIGDTPGSRREPTRHPTGIETPDFKLTVSTTDVDSWELWHRAFGGQSQRTDDAVESRLVFLGPDRVEPLARIELRETALASLEIGPASDPENGQHHVTIELINGKTSFDKEVP